MLATSSHFVIDNNENDDPFLLASSAITTNIIEGFV